MRLRLLEDELNACHVGVSAYAGRASQVKGWCITVASGLLALAITQERAAIAFCAVASVCAFWLAESHVASIQRVMIDRLQYLESHFRDRSATEALSDRTLALPGMASGYIDDPKVDNWLKRLRVELDLTIREAKSPYRILFYALIMVGVVLVCVATFSLPTSAAEGTSDPSPTSSSCPANTTGR